MCVSKKKKKKRDSSCIMAGHKIFHVVECYETDLIKNKNLKSAINMFFILKGKSFTLRISHPYVIRSLAEKSFVKMISFRFIKKTCLFHFPNPHF